MGVRDIETTNRSKYLGADDGMKTIIETPDSKITTNGTDNIVILPFTEDFLQERNTGTCLCGAGSGFLTLTYAGNNCKSCSDSTEPWWTPNVNKSFDGGNWINYNPGVYMKYQNPNGTVETNGLLKNVIIPFFTPKGSTSYTTINNDNKELVKIRNTYETYAYIDYNEESCNWPLYSADCIGRENALNSALEKGWNQVINNFNTQESRIAQVLFLFCMGKSEIPPNYQSKIVFSKNSSSNPTLPPSCQ